MSRKGLTICAYLSNASNILVKMRLPRIRPLTPMAKYALSAPDRRMKPPPTALTAALAFAGLLLGVGCLASERSYTFNLDGAHAIPPTSSQGSAEGSIVCDPATDILTINMSYASLTPIHSI